MLDFRKYELDLWEHLGRRFVGMWGEWGVVCRRDWLCIVF